MRRTFWVVAALAFAASILLGAAREVVVLKGGARMDLSAPMVRQGNVVLLTRTDGTVFSVPASEIDFAATAALKSAPPPAPPSQAITPEPSSPAEAARAPRTKARVRITDNDVNHNLEFLSPEGEKKKAGAAGSLTPARVEVGDYTQSKNGEMLVIHGALRNVGASTATGVRVGVAALGDKGETLSSSEGTLSGGTIEPGQQVEFSAGLKVGQKVVTTLRFSPVWTAAPLPAAPESPGSSASSASSTSAGAGTGTSGEGYMSPDTKPASKAAAPTPVPTPYGRGTLYAPPVPSSSMEPPKDGRGGYIPGATRKEDQPKPPQ